MPAGGEAPARGRGEPRLLRGCGSSLQDASVAQAVATRPQTGRAPGAGRIAPARRNRVAYPIGVVGTDSKAPDAVVVSDLAKRFVVPRERSHTLKERVLHPLGRRAPDDRLDALNGVSFGVPAGEFCGIVGRNGSGKSTLLKCLAGIYRADRGTIHVRGRMSAFIELGVGFNPDLAARDNIAINAIMLGLSPREARALRALSASFA